MWATAGSTPWWPISTNRCPPCASAATPRGLTAELEDLVTSCLQKEPADRPADAATLKGRLRDLLAGQVDATTGSGRLSTESVIRRAQIPSFASDTQPTLDRPRHR